MKVVICLIFIFLIIFNLLKMEYKNILSYKIIIKIKLYLMTGLLIFLFSNQSKILAQASVVNFSGTWTFKESDRILGGTSAFYRSSSMLTIFQVRNQVSIERIRHSQSGEEFKTKDKFTLDGKEWVNTETDRIRKSKSVWSADKRSLIISSLMVINLNGINREYKTLEIWKLTDAGKSLSIDYTSNPPNGPGKNTVVYIKK